MNKEEAIERIEKLDEHYGISQGVYLKKRDVVSIVSQIDEPQKPVVPKFVAEWIEYCKRDKFYALHGAYENMDEEMKYWRFIGNNSALFAKAWIDGYEVEKEKLYTVEIPNPNRTSFSYTLYRKDDEKIIIIGAGDDYEKREEYQLTEAEIKQDFEWAWQFAKEVEEK